MKNINPICPNTITLENEHVWNPRSFSDFFTELDHIVGNCKGLPFYRGQRKKAWLLDSTFVRNTKKYIYGLPTGTPFHPIFQQTRILHTTLLNLFLTKFTYFIQPSDELIQREKEHDIDSWFEFFKQLQQAPGRWEHPEFRIHGTNILDWSQSRDVGIFFANENRKKEGALWIFDKCVIPKSQTVKKIFDVINLMDEKGNSPQPQSLGAPCIFFPEKQINHFTAKRQSAIYLSQMDMRYDLSQFWLKHEHQWGERTFIKLILPHNSIEEFDEYLTDNGINNDYIYPNKERI